MNSVTIVDFAKYIQENTDTFLTEAVRTFQNPEATKHEKALALTRLGQLMSNVSQVLANREIPALVKTSESALVCRDAAQKVADDFVRALDRMGRPIKDVLAPTSSNVLETREKN